MNRTLSVAALSVVAAVGLPSAPADAHVVLTRAEVPSETVLELELRAPVERPGTTNKQIYALVPGPFQVRKCTSPSAVWRCTLDTGRRPGSTFITWDTPVGGSPQDLRFTFTALTPPSADAGDYKMPVVQTYSDGHVARWIDDDEPAPAPRLTVIRKGQPVSTAPPAAAPDAPARSGDTPTTAAPAVSSRPGTPAGADAVPSVTVPSVRGSVPGPAAVAAGPAGGGVVASSGPTVGPADAPAPADAAPQARRGDRGEDSSSKLLPTAAGAALLCAAAVAVARVRRRRP